MDLISQPALPERIGRLYELANNLWWSWHEDGRQLFRSLDYGLWRTTNHNPVQQLRTIGPQKLQNAAEDPVFLALYDSVMSLFDADMSNGEKWFSRTYLGGIQGPIAYFSAEFAIHSSLPIYAGGLGILAGDTCKEASDLGIPLVAVGFMYPQGYFNQRISPEGWQEEIYRQLDFNHAPITQCAGLPERSLPVSIKIGSRTLYLSLWQVRVGRVNLYLLDTNVERNAVLDRSLSARLYAGDRELRLQQLIALGVGGVRALRSLGISPSVWHANEDHTAFMLLERLREHIQKGDSFDKALQEVRATTIFTTHTPVPAGHSIFPIELVQQYLPDFWQELGIDQRTFMKLGQYEGAGSEAFSLTALALRLSDYRNAVSKMHATVSRRIWHVLWPETPEQEIPITYVTNGVHLPTWQSPELYELCQQYGSGKKPLEQDDAEYWSCLADIPDDEFWEVHQLMKRRLMRSIKERAQQRWVQDNIPAQQVLSMGAFLNAEVLTIAFTRRFAEYKRAALIFQDIERLKKIVTKPMQRVQIILAGKSHPADFASKYILNQVYSLATNRDFEGQIAFVEEYDVHLARDLVRGADIWLNTPRRLQEACGTSGMKASANGVVHMSVRDGWWDEAYNGANGYAIGEQTKDPAEEDKADAEALYQPLENVIVPLYYDQDRKGVPHSWIKIAKEAIRSIAPAYSTSRMLKEYTERMYMAAARRNVTT